MQLKPLKVTIVYLEMWPLVKWFFSVELLKAGAWRQGVQCLTPRSSSGADTDRHGLPVTWNLLWVPHFHSY